MCENDVQNVRGDEPCIVSMLGVQFPAAPVGENSNASASKAGQTGGSAASLAPPQGTTAPAPTEEAKTPSPEPSQAAGDPQVSLWWGLYSSGLGVCW